MVGRAKPPDQKNNINKEQNSLEAKAVPETAMEKVLSPYARYVLYAPTPEESNYVKIGDAVKKGQTLCIIEAMKIMNEL